MITALRWIKKPDGTKVLQYRNAPDFGITNYQDHYAAQLWQDVPTIEEKQDAE